MGILTNYLCKTTKPNLILNISNSVSQFRLCDPIEKSIKNDQDISNLFENLASLFAGVVQYNKDYSPHARVTIDQVCDIMVNTTIGPQVNRLAEVNRLMMNEQKDKCFDYKYEKMVTEMKNVSWDSDVASGCKQIYLNYIESV